MEFFYEICVVSTTPPWLAYSAQDAAWISARALLTSSAKGSRAAAWGSGAARWGQEANRSCRVDPAVDGQSMVNSCLNDG